jgi:MerR family transcriptional regulator, mercuric resistance operon regulatory protein
LQVQGLQRQPPRVSSLAAWTCCSVWVVIVKSPFRTLSNSGRMAYGIRTMVRNQAKSSDTIGGLAKAAGVGVETVRYYQRRGLLPEPARPPGEVRRYGDEDVKRLKFVRAAQAAGFTLAEIGELLELDASDDRARARELARARVAALDAKIDELRQARDALAGLARACASKLGGPCPILGAFEPK